MSKIKIAILFGGCSEEHDVSIKSARELAKNLDREKYEPIYIGISREGAWKKCPAPDGEWENDNCQGAIISPDRKARALLLYENGQWQSHHIDVVFPVLHGKMGEDGKIQGLLELSGIPYVGCDVQSSVASMDKSLAYLLAENAGIAIPKFWILNPGDKIPADEIAYPIFVKPARSGSSFGITKVHQEAELAAGIEEARRYDSKVLLEQAVPGIEVGCAILGNGADLILGEVDQITLSHGFFRIHQEANPEQGSENALFTVPANLPPEQRRHIQNTGKSIYKALGCRGLARVDMFFQEDGHIVLNEVNTLPGFTSYSRYPRMMLAAGIKASEMIDRLITLALEG